MKYLNPQRKVGSQCETPSLTKVSDGLKIGGYQHYIITNKEIIPYSYPKKFDFLNNFLKSQSKTTVADLGASNGIISLLALRAGHSVYSLELDTECLDLMKKIQNYYKYADWKIDYYQFGDDIKPVDVVVMGALIHWIFSCTALFGEFDSIFTYLRKITQKILLIEWVDPRDPAIKYFKHTDFNKSIIKQPYTEELFLKSISKYFSKAKKVFDVTTTRRFYLVTV